MVGKYRKVWEFVLFAIYSFCYKYYCAIKTMFNCKAKIKQKKEKREKKEQTFLSQVYSKAQNF